MLPSKFRLFSCLMLSLPTFLDWYLFLTDKNERSLLCFQLMSSINCPHFFLRLELPLVATAFCNYPRGDIQHIHIRGRGSFQEIFGKPKNITSPSLQPKNIGSLYALKPIHEHEIFRNKANRSQDCLQRTQKYLYNNVWCKKIS